MRLDKAALSLWPEVPRAEIVRAFARGGVFLDGAPAAKGDRARAGALMRIEGPIHEAADLRAQPCDGPLSLVYADDELLAFDKPAGQNCHPVLAAERDTLVNAMLARFPETAAIGGDPMTPALVHRIDRETSGLVLAARTEAAYRSLRAQFAAHTVEKHYVAVVHGMVGAPGGVSGHLAHTPGDRGRMRVVTVQTAPRNERPMHAETFYRPIRALAGNLTLLDVTILSGVTHQIRCQLASVGHPIVGDPVYGTPGERLFLHSRSATFVHPATGKRITLVAEPPEEFGFGR